MCRLKPSLQREPAAPQTGDSSDMALWISLMLASCGGVLGCCSQAEKKRSGIRLSNKQTGKSACRRASCKICSPPRAAGIFSRGFFYPFGYQRISNLI
ncbi:MAG: sortase B protein-sorting domain-containing protein [Neglectibacter timonensis]